MVLLETKKFLEHIANNIGEQTNEYTWREACGLIREIDLCIDPNNPMYKEDKSDLSIEDKTKAFYIMLDCIISMESTARVLDFVMDRLDDLCIEKKYEECNDILAKLSTEKYSLQFILGFLSITYTCRKHLPAREALIESLKSISVITQNLE
ncbi:MAG: hypothetical protein WC979_02885 [Candidatus Pacearchaeota archaeon]|jgi:hypothetical protein